MVETSQGWLEIAYSDIWPIRSSVVVTAFADDGWETEARGWSPRYGGNRRGETLAEFLGETFHLSSSEARDLAERVVRGWSARHRATGEADRERRFHVVLAATVFGALALVGFAVFTLASLLVALFR